MDDRSKYMIVGRPKGTIKDPNRLKIMNPNGRKIDVDGVQYNRYINIIITPGTITESAKKYTLFDYDLHIVNEIDPIIQMKLLATCEKVIIKRALKIHKGVTFNTSMEIEFIKNDGEVKNTFTFTPKLMTINSKDEISNARRAMNNHINGMIDRYTNPSFSERYTKN